jgi:Zn-dependent alcohol dehydrogenase
VSVRLVLIWITGGDADMKGRGINAGSKTDMDDLCAALSATKIQFDDIIDSVQPFESAEEAVEKVWQGKVVGKLVLVM